MALSDRRFPLRAKLVVAFLVVTSFVAVTGAVGSQGHSTAHDSAQYIYDDEMPVKDASMEMRLAL